MIQKIQLSTFLTNSFFGSARHDYFWRLSILLHLGFEKTPPFTAAIKNTLAYTRIL